MQYLSLPEHDYTILMTVTPGAGTGSIHRGERGELMASSGMTSSYVHMQNSLRRIRQRCQRLHGTGMVQNGG
ncbi:hypothetical protein EAF00_001185 [Botryotinia globosa]|nr:hypothetical protein EAF00_001185 [Botryotinia globosa]